MLHSLPKHLVLGSECADVTVNLIKRYGLDSDDTSSDVFNTVVDYACRDDAKQNVKSENFLEEESSSRGENHCDIACFAHKKAKVTEHTCSAIPNAIDTRYIRLAIVARGSVHTDIKCSGQQILAGNLVCVDGACQDAVANQKRAAFYDLFFDKNTPIDVWGRRICEALFNGDLDGPLMHHEVGCCSDFEETLHLMQTYGMQALFGRRLKPMSRKSWIGAKQSMKDLKMSKVHNLFSLALLRAMPAPETPAAADAGTQVAVRGNSGAAAGDAADRCHDKEDAVDPPPPSVWREESTTRVSQTEAMGNESRISRRCR